MEAKIINLKTSTQMKRSTGYYWVKRLPDQDGNTEFEIAFYQVLPNRSIWLLMAFDDLEFGDDSFIEINENKIPTPNEMEVLETKVSALLSQMKELELLSEDWHTRLTEAVAKNYKLQAKINELERKA